MIIIFCFLPVISTSIQTKLEVNLLNYLELVVVLVWNRGIIVKVMAIHYVIANFISLYLIVKLVTQCPNVANSNGYDGFVNFHRPYHQHKSNKLDEWENGFSHLVQREDMVKYSTLYINTYKSMFKLERRLNVELRTKKHIGFLIILLLSGDVSINPGPSHRKDVESLRIMVVNFQSIKNKSAEIKVLLDNYKPDIVQGTETWLSNDVFNSEFFPDNYEVHRRDRQDGIHGGILTACKQGITMIRKKELEVDTELM